MTYTVRYFDPSRAAVLERLVQAHSADAAREQVQAEGLVFIAAHADAAKKSTVDDSSRRSSKAFNVAWWCRELRTLLHAGMTVVEALETLQAQSPQGQRGEIQSGLIKALREGRPLSRAMQDAGVFPPVLVAGVKASERTSTLVTALDDFMRHDEMMSALRKQVVSAALYPAVVVALGFLIVLFLLLYVVPRFSGMYADFQGSLSSATRLLLWVSRGVAIHTPWVIGGLGATALFGVWLVQSGWAMRGVANLLSRIDSLQQQWDHFRLAKLYHSLALMFKGGYTLDEALGVCETLGLGVRMTQGLGRARTDLGRGRNVSASLTQAGLTDAVSERLLAVGERTGSFDLVLQTIAQRHAGAFTTFVERATRLVEPVLLLMVALLVGGIVVLMYMPIFDIANGIR